MFSGSGRRLAALAACTPLVLVGACSDDPADGADPDPTPSDSESTSASSSDSASASESPSAKPTRKYPEDKPATKISAEDVARAWLTAYGQALLTGDTSRMRGVSIDACTGCGVIAQKVEDIYAAGGSVSVESAPFKVLNDEVRSAESSDEVLIRLQVREAAGETIMKAGQEPTRYEGTTRPWDFTVSLRNGRWKIKSVDF